LGITYEIICWYSRSERFYQTCSDHFEINQDHQNQIFSFEEIIDDEFSIKKFEDSKQKKVDFHGRNIMPIPHVLTKVYLSVEKVDPNSVAQAFYIAMKEYDMKTKTHDLEATTESDLVDEDIQDSTETMKENTAEEISSITEKEDGVVPSGDKCSSTFIHILQF